MSRFSLIANLSLIISLLMYNLPSGALAVGYDAPPPPPPPPPPVVPPPSCCCPATLTVKATLVVLDNLPVSFAYILSV